MNADRGFAEDNGAVLAHTGMPDQRRTQLSFGAMSGTSTAPAPSQHWISTPLNSLISSLNLYKKANLFKALQNAGTHIFYFDLRNPTSFLKSL